MNFAQRLLSCFFAFSLLCSLITAQQTSSAGPVVPRLMNFSGKTADAQGKPIGGIAGVTLAIYKEQYGGAPLWLETQNVQADVKGNYTVQLGATKPQGLPLDLFSSGEARWLGVSVNGGAEQPRVLLLSVPYALKAADAETIGGLPPSAFMLAAPPAMPASTTSTASAGSQSSTRAPLATGTTPVTTAGGATNKLAKFDAAADITNSLIFDNGTNVGIGNTAPTAKLDVSGGATVRGLLYLPATGTATSTAGKNSQALNLAASAFNTGTGSAVSQNFRLQAEPTGNNSVNTSGTLNLLYNAGSNTPAETGLKISNKGLFTFAPGQTFPGTGSVTSVGLSAPSADFTVTGSPVTHSGTLALSWKVPPTNANTANAIVKRDASGNFIATSITATGRIFAEALSGNGNAISGSSASSTATVIYGGANSSTGATWGVEGETFSGDLGTSGVLGRGHFGNSVGVTGLNVGATGVGVLGQYGTQSSTGSIFTGLYPVGVWGDGGPGSSFPSIGVLGTVDDGYAGKFDNNSVSGFTTFEAYAHNSASYPFVVGNLANGSSCNIDPSGNLNCTGLKHAIVPIDGGKRTVALSAIESPENWFEDFGSAQLANGVAVIHFDPDFIQTVNTEKDYRVFPVPNGDCRGLYVTNKSANSFEVRELGGGSSNIRFDYRITAIRRKYETVRFEDHTNDPDPRKMLEQMRKVKPASSSAPASVKPALQPVPAVPVAHLTNR